MAEDTSDLYRNRLDKLRRLEDAGETPYKYAFTRTHTIPEARSAFEESEREGIVVKVAGRILTVRKHGKSSFADIKDGFGTIQLFFSLKELGEDRFELLSELDIGDFVGAEGELFRTRTGEVTVKVSEWELLSKSLRALPAKWHGLADVETRYRQRYLDLIANPEVFELFRKRSRIIGSVRAFLEGEGFLEVATPMLQPIPGGATARPFVTHHNAYDRDLYLRIAPELYLKRLLVGGFEKVYELGRTFRNEGVSTRHNPEFTILEVYQAYVDYNDIMDLTERLIVHVARETMGTLSFEYQGRQVNLEPPWQRVPLYEAIARDSGIDFSGIDGDDTAKRAARDHGIDVPDSAGYGKVVDEVMKTKVVPNLTQPAFLYDYPIEISPLAKTKRGNPRLTERFQAFIAGLEMGNAFSELNDSVEQTERFAMQAAQRDAGDDEAQRLDTDFVTALEHGMPPAGGLGIGIDRLVMLLTDSASIRDVVLFPQLRPVG